jgi:asparagine synthase (glutamine-hydrolysing)
MCGILCIFGNTEGLELFPDDINHRGPDEIRVVERPGLKLYFSRLAIRGTEMQPFEGPDDEVFACNGEIYNHLELGGSPVESDCRTLWRQIREHGLLKGIRNCQQGEFAFVHFDGKNIFAGRDNVGVRPLFTCSPRPGTIIFSSELKPIRKYKCGVFPPGHFYNSITDTYTRWRQLCPPKAPLSISYTYKKDMTNTFIKAVQDRVNNSERDTCFLLSGGLDSSLVCAIAYFYTDIETLHMFTIGEKDSPDVLAAQEVSTFFKTMGKKKIKHTIINFDPLKAQEYIPQVIQSLESYDTTTVRASVPMWLLCKYINEHTTYRVLLSGEGSDELLAGYRYFKNAPGPEELYIETARRVHKLHEFDVLRADRCTAAHGLELRAPFLDSRFLDVCFKIDPREKMLSPEKKPLRELFPGILPHEIMWRTKEAFSDAVGYDWVTHLRETFKNYPMCKREHNHPTTGEESYYRETYEGFFGTHNEDLISEIWRPMWTDDDLKDPSARYI